ncbi:MAG: ABC transporter substrate-binding protein [Candidatus Diapherotrites archaeon]
MPSVRIVVFFVVVLAVAGTAVWYAQLQTPSGLAVASSNPVQIGAILPMTGKAANFGENARNGIELALSEINSSGEKISVLYEDEQCDPKFAVSAFQSLRARNIHLFVGGSCSSSSLAIAPLAEKDKTVLFALSAADALSSSGDYIFRNHLKVSVDIPLLAEYASKHYSNVGILYDAQNDAYLQAAQLFSARFSGRSILIPVLGTQGDFRSELLKAKNSGADALFVVTFTPNAVQIARQNAELGFSAPILTRLSVATKEFVSGAGALSNGVVFVDGNWGEQTSPEFWHAFREKFGTNPTLYAAEAFDNLKLLALAVENCGEDTSCVRDFLYKVKDYNGVSGTISIDSNGDVLKKVALFRIQDGNFIPLSN